MVNLKIAPLRMFIRAIIIIIFFIIIKAPITILVEGNQKHSSDVSGR